jgi:FixJ family two-component response regulator
MMAQALETAPGAPVIHVVEDDLPTRTAIARLLRAAGHAVGTYATAAEFLATAPAEGPGCLVLDVRLPGSNGLELQEMLSADDDALPIIFVTGYGDIPMSVRAIRSGAVDFLTKPVRGAVLLDAVSRALACDAEHRAARERQRDARTRFERLTPREREVFAHLIAGQLNKQVAFDLGTSERTIKAHRHSVLRKLEAGSVADLVRLASNLSIAPVGLASGRPS